MGIITKFFELFPYCFPCIIVSFLNVISFCIGLKCLPNNTSKKQETIESTKEQETMDVELNEVTEENIETFSEKPTVELIPSKSSTWKMRFLKSTFMTTLKETTNRNSIICYIIYCCNALMFIIHDEAVPLLFVKKVSEGGLGFDSTQIGIFYSITGSTLILFQLFLFKRLTGWLGKLFVLKSGLIFTLPLLLGMPHIYRVSSIPAVLWICITILGKQSLIYSFINRYHKRSCWSNDIYNGYYAHQ